MRKARLNRKFLFPAAALLGLSLLWCTTPAAACCVYNKADYPLGVKLDESTWSEEDWTIAPSNHRCTRGKGGTAILWMFEPDRYYVQSNTVDIVVDDHGWIEVYAKEGSKWKVLSKRKDGSIKDTQYLKYEPNK